MEDTWIAAGRRMAFWPLLALAVPQAVWVRSRAPRFPGAAGPPEGRVGRGRPLRLVAVGDSIIAGVGAPTLALAAAGRTAERLAGLLGREVHWIAHGRIGAGIEDVRTALVQALRAGPCEIVLVSAGVNDVTSLTRTADWRRGLRAMVDDSRKQAPEAVLAFIGLPPLWGFPLLPWPLRRVLGMRARTFDAVARHELASAPNSLHVPVDFDPRPELFSADGYHPSEASHARLGLGIADLLARRIALRDEPR